MPGRRTAWYARAGRLYARASARANPCLLPGRYGDVEEVMLGGGHDGGDLFCFVQFKCAQARHTSRAACTPLAGCTAGFCCARASTEIRLMVRYAAGML